MTEQVERNLLEETVAEAVVAVENDEEVAAEREGRAEAVRENAPGERK